MPIIKEKFQWKQHHMRMSQTAFHTYHSCPQPVYSEAYFSILSARDILNYVTLSTRNHPFEDFGKQLQAAHISQPAQILPNLMGHFYMSCFLTSACFLVSSTLDHSELASCPLGPATAHGEGTLTEMEVMYKIRSVGLLAEVGEVVTHERTERITDHYYGLGRICIFYA